MKADPLFMIWDCSGSIVVLGDLHHPFSHRPSVNRAIGLIYSLKPKAVIQIGDLYDCYSQTKFPRRISMTPKDEMKHGRYDAELLWSMIKDASPNSKLVQLLGNHDDRPYKRLLEKAPELEPFMNVASPWDFAELGVETIYDSRDAFEFEGITFIHGHFTRLGMHTQRMEYRNIVHGHSHRGGVHFQRLSSGRIAWELDVGYLGDPFHEALLYRPMKKYFDWTHGIGMIDRYGPRFIPF